MRLLGGYGCGRGCGRGCSRGCSGSRFHGLGGQALERFARGLGGAAFSCRLIGPALAPQAVTASAATTAAFALAALGCASLGCLGRLGTGLGSGGNTVIGTRHGLHTRRHRLGTRLIGHCARCGLLTQALFARVASAFRPFAIGATPTAAPPPPAALTVRFAFAASRCALCQRGCGNGHNLARCRLGHCSGCNGRAALGGGALAGALAPGAAAFAGSFAPFARLTALTGRPGLTCLTAFATFATFATFAGLTPLATFARLTTFTAPLARAATTSAATLTPTAFASFTSVSRACRRAGRAGGLT